MLPKVLNLFKDNYQPLNKIYIHQNQLIENYKILNNYVPNVVIAPVLKSNAYGHGIIQTAKIIDTQNPALICVDSLPEANVLRKSGIKTEILIMGAIANESLNDQLSFHLTVMNNDICDQILKQQHKAKVHLFIDTGMNREGIKLDELNEVINKIKATNCNLVGLMTHLAVAHDKNHSLTKKQIENFRLAKKMVMKAGLNPKWVHIGGSDALSWISPQLVNMVRTGRLLYGVQSNNLKDLKPVLTLESSIVQIKHIKKGESVGYDATYTAQKDTTIALLPIGYNDGVDRGLSNKGTVYIEGIECLIIGLISMNMTTIDITKVKDVSVGQKVTVFSEKSSDINSIENAAKKINTNPSDLLVGLHSGTRRESI